MFLLLCNWICVWVHCFYLDVCHTPEVTTILLYSWELLEGVCSSEPFPLQTLQLRPREVIQVCTQISSLSSLSPQHDIRNPQSRMNKAHLHLKLVKKSKCQDVFYSLATLVYANCTPLFRRYGMSGLIFLIVTLSRND